MKHICKNCKYFKVLLDMSNTCDCPKFIYTGFSNEVSRTSDCLGYSDYEGYNASIEVGENFGCIHWEKLESEE